MLFLDLLFENKPAHQCCVLFEAEFEYVYYAIFNKPHVSLCNKHTIVSLCN